MFLNEQGKLELEGCIEELQLPTSLTSSIRLRLSALEECDPTLGLLLQVASVLGGAFSLAQVEPVWRVLYEAKPAETVADVIARGVQAHLLKYLSSSGVQSQLKMQSRRRSSAANTQGSFTFQRRAGLA